MHISNSAISEENFASSRFHNMIYKARLLYLVDYIAMTICTH